MKAAYLYGPRDIRVTDTHDSEPAPGELLLDVTAVGICGSDLHSYLFGQIGDTVVAKPLILGHEAGGVVAAIGVGVESFRVGQIVAIDPAIPCEQCEFCLAGHPNLCNRLIFIGLAPYDGAMRERMTHPARACVPVPDGMGAIEAALLEPLGVALHAIRLAKIEVGDDVLVTGCGAIGLLIIQLARLAGARHIFATDKYGWRLDLAANFGADVLIDVTKQQPVEEVLRATERRGIDVAIESAWVTDTINHCIDSARNGGRIVIVGIPVEEMIAMRGSPARRKGLTVKFSRRMKHTYPTSIALAAANRIKLMPLASHRFPLAQTADAFETASTYADSVVRAMILPNER